MAPFAIICFWVRFFKFARMHLLLLTVASLSLVTLDSESCLLVERMKTLEGEAGTAKDL